MNLKKTILTHCSGILIIFASCQKDKIINGYTDRISYRQGETVSVFLNAHERADDATVRLTDINGTAVASVTTSISPQDTFRNSPWENGFRYKLSFKFPLPELKSGIYMWDNKVPFVVKARNPEIVVVYSSNTDNAYCNAGEKSLYDYNSSDNQRAHVVSFQRPISLPFHSSEFLKWFSSLAYEHVGYIADSDLDDYKNLEHARLLLIVGHSEYWTRKARENFDRFVDSGKDAIILSGNTMWWQVRYSDDGSQLICFKGITENPPASRRDETINWDTPTLEYPIINSIGVEFRRAGFGLVPEDKGWNGFKILRPQSPLLEGTGLEKGDILALESDETDGTAITAGYEPDKEKLPYQKMEIIGYDSVFMEGKHGVATWIVAKKSDTSGIIINVASTDWCSKKGIKRNFWGSLRGRSDFRKIRKITLTMIDKLLKKKNVFSE